MTEISKHHGLFFKKVFSRPDAAETFVLNFLPPNVTGLLKPNSFRPSKGSFVDERLKEHFSDLLYSVDLKNGKEAYVYLLFEHKSDRDLKVAYQLLRYLTRLWDETTKCGVEPVRPVIPIVLYHGTKKWTVSTDFAALYDPPDNLLPELLNFRYYLCDLSGYSDEEIRMRCLAAATLAAALLLMKNFFRPDLSKRLKEYFDLLDNMEQQTGLQFLEAVFHYLGAARERVTPEDVGQALKDSLGKKGEIYMYSLADKWIDEGVEQGMQQGMQEGMLRGVASLTIRQLTRRFGELDESTQERIQQLPLEELERLGEDLLDFPDRSALDDWLDVAAH